MFYARIYEYTKSNFFFLEKKINKIKNLNELNE